jgi:hypothetical protein
MPVNAPAGTNDYVYPGLIEQKESAAIDRAEQEARGEITNPIVRDIIPYLDFDAGADTYWDGAADGWLVSPSSDGPGEYEVYEIDSDTGKADDRTVAIYGFEAVSGLQYVEAVNFVASDGQTFERAQVTGLDESGDTQVDRQKTLRSPISFGAQENGAIEIVVNDDYSSGTGVGDTDIIELKLLGVTAEKLGRRVGSRQ